MHHHGINGHSKCYGSTVVGERGQVVIPAEAREEMQLGPGDKLIVFGNPRRGMVILFRGDIMARFTEALMGRFHSVERLFRELSSPDSAGTPAGEDEAPNKGE